MDRHDLIDFLNKLEKKYPVSEWKIDGLDVWPIVKMDLFFKWWNKDNKTYNTLLQKHAVKKDSIFKKMASVMTSFFHLIKLVMRKHEKVALLLSGSAFHRVEFNGQFLNRYFDPVAHFVKETLNQKYLMVEYSSEDLTKNYTNRTNTIFLTKSYLAMKVMHRFYGKHPDKTNLVDVDSFLTDFNAEVPGVIVKDTYLKTLSATIDEIEIYARLYRIILKKSNPSLVFELCYYNKPIFALNFAAHQFNISTIDMQHGGIGSTHPGYSHFLKIPNGGFNVMPEIFWSWDDASAKGIDQWVKQQTHHRVITGGNPWYSYFIDKKNSNAYPDKKIILYTMQFNFPEKRIIEAIKKTSPDYIWWLRLHPRTLPIKNKLEAFLQEENVLHKINIDEATKFPLPEILLNSVIHISGFSGSIVEASSLGVKTIIIEEIGIEHYKDYIERGEAVGYLADSPDEFLKLMYQNQTTPALKNKASLLKFKTIIKELIEQAR